MQIPLRFPNHADKTLQLARQQRQLTPSQRFLNIVDLIASGTRMLAESPKRKDSDRLHRANEAEWRRVYRELFARHGF